MTKYKFFDIDEILEEHFEDLFRKIESIGANEELSDYSDVMEIVELAKSFCKEHGATNTATTFDDLIEIHETAKKELASDEMEQFMAILADMGQNVTKEDIGSLLEEYGWVSDINVPERDEMEKIYAERFGRVLADDYYDFWTNHHTVSWEI